MSRSRVLCLNLNFLYERHKRSKLGSGLSICTASPYGRTSRGGWLTTARPVLRDVTPQGVPSQPGIRIEIFDQGENMRASSLNRLQLCIGAGVALFVTAASAQTETVLYSFSSPIDPSGRFMQLKSSAILGTSFYGGSKGEGTIYQLKEKSGTWYYRLVLNFKEATGANPYDGLTIDKAGNVFGATEDGGANNFGTVFALTPNTHGGWTQTVLHNFTGSDGAYPEDVLIADSTNNTLYGTTSSTVGGSGCGNVFSITSDGKYGLLYSFKGGKDGCQPQTGMTFGQTQGTIFGTTLGGGASGNGTVFSMKESQGSWTEKVIYAFAGTSDGQHPTDFRVDAKGNLFGLAAGGQYGQGVVFELTKSFDHWREKTIYSFTGGSDGATPIGLHIDLTTGTIYGSTQFGGTYGEGTVFKLAHSGGGWSESVLHSFGGPGDGAYPVSRPIQDKVSGNIYGTTNQGGQYGDGVVYMIVP